ncbi:MAG TPA: YncE family protein, partial [Chitinophagales bacterium]|nr:YncE family protein [Chitinophagales bacterium]
PEIEQITLQPGVAPSATPKNDPHEIAFTPDKTEYLVTCQRTNEVRFFDAAADSLIAIVPTGVYPQEIAFSSTTDYVFISCMEDNLTFAGNVGSVSVINYRTHTLVKSINTGFQPHGLSVDDESMQVFVANRNANPNGPAPHHTTGCGGRNGYLTIIDMNTLELVSGFRAELSVDPYFVAVRR